MARACPSWRKLHQIYGSEDWGAIVALALQGLALAISTGASLLYFKALTLYLTRAFPFLPIQVWSLLVGFVAGFMGLMCVCFLVTAANLWHSSLILRWRVVQQMMDKLDWSCLHLALDVGCGSGMLLNTVASRLKKQRAGGHVVGVDLWLDRGSKSMSSTLQSAAFEQVHEYVTCKSGDPRSLPFEDDHFDGVMSALCLHKLGSEYGPRTTAANCERLKGLQEIVRVLKPGGQGILWDLCHVPEYAIRLEQLNMCDVKVSSCIPAFMMQSHILTFKKPLHLIH
eukprot:c44932_g1_i1 orf=62-910(-)